MNVLKPEKQLAVIATLVEGNSVRSTERLTGVHRDTILRLVVKVGENCEKIMRERMKDLRCPRLQVDEIWTFCLKKQRRLSYEERHALGMAISTYSSASTRRASSSLTSRWANGTW